MPTAPSSTPTPTSTMSKFIVWLVIVAIVVFGGAYFVYTTMTQMTGRQDEKIIPGDDVQNLLKMRQAGDYEGVVGSYETVASDPSKSSTDKASAAISGAGAEFHVTGDINDRLEDVRRLKETIVEPSIALRTRVLAINRLASQYRDSGRNPVVFEEIYKGEPFQNYLVPNDPELSARHLYEWSYAQLPTSVAAISIAKWYSEQSGFNSGLSEEIKKTYLAAAEDYLQKADMAVVGEKERNVEFVQGTNYLIYRNFKAYVIGRLARQVGEPYKSQYRKEYDEFIQFAQNFENVMAKEYISFARFAYAIELSYDKDTDGAKYQLDTLATELDALEKPNTHGFVLYVLNMYSHIQPGSSWAVMPGLFEISPSFKATVKRITASAPKADL